jgi:DNA-binding XRE family transcriptional regulator
MPKPVDAAGVTTPAIDVVRTFATIRRVECRRQRCSSIVKRMGIRPRKHKFESAALQFVHDRYVGDNPEQQAAYEDEFANAEVARALYELRAKAGLTQRELAKLVGTTASAISRLEDARYEGHSLAMLRRIATAFDKRLELRFVARKKSPSRSVARKRKISEPAKRRAVLTRG